MQEGLEAMFTYPGMLDSYFFFLLHFFKITVSEKRFVLSVQLSISADILPKPVLHQDMSNQLCVKIECFRVDVIQPCDTLYYGKLTHLYHRTNHMMVILAVSKYYFRE